MPKTKTQAEKRKEHEDKLKQQQEKSRLEREATALAIKQKNEKEKQEEEILFEVAASKKELRKQKKNGCSKTTPDAGTNSSFVDDDFVFPEKNSNNNKQAELTAQSISNAIKEEQTSTSHSSTKSRLVSNHSTYCDGLRPILAKLQKKLHGCTIIPGKISSTSNHLPDFELRFQRMADDHTYKFVARNGYTTQDVSITVSNKDVFTKEVIESDIKNILDEKLDKEAHFDNETGDSINISLSSYNRGLAEARNNLWKEQHHRNFEKTVEKQREANQRHKIENQKRKLANKAVPRDELETYAERDVDIISGKTHGKYSMK